MRGGGGGGVDAAGAPARRARRRLAPEAATTPQSPMMMSPEVSPPREPQASTALMTLPFEDSTVCLPLRNGVATGTGRTAELVLGPALAMDRMPGPWWGSEFSSANVRP